MNNDHFNDVLYDCDETINQIVRNWHKSRMPEAGNMVSAVVDAAGVFVFEDLSQKKRGVEDPDGGGRLAESVLVPPGISRRKTIGRSKWKSVSRRSRGDNFGFTGYFGGDSVCFLADAEVETDGLSGQTRRSKGSGANALAKQNGMEHNDSLRKLMNLHPEMFGQNLEMR